jgi:NADPH-dependent 2,4-dienoyl-CoA reductase/sulfur reductase-like enzyme
VVIGGDAAGMSAASQARRRRDPDDLQIVAFEQSPFTSYSACGIPYWIGGSVDGPEELVARSPAEHRKQGIDVRIRTRVTAIDLAARTVQARDLEAGREYDEPFDCLVYATGSVPMRPPIPGIDAAGVYGMQTLADGAALRGELDGDRVRRVVIIGGGYIGLEIAEACQTRGLDVTIVDRSPTPVGTFDPDIGTFIADAIRGMGISMILSEAATEIETGSSGWVVAVHTEAGRRLPADLVVLGLGVRPDVALAEEAGIPLGTSGGIAVDNRMRTQAEGVWAAGDCVESVHRLSGRRVVVALGTHANKQGRVVGINIGGGYATFPGIIGTAVTKVCDLEVARTGMSEAEADAAGFCYVTASVDSTTRAGYFPGAQPIRTKLLAEKRTGRLLGAQIVGREGAAKRIDVFATAIWNGMTAAGMVDLDLSYAPPFSPVWDPVLVTARKLAERVERSLAAGVGGAAG